MNKRYFKYFLLVLLIPVMLLCSSCQKKPSQENLELKEGEIYFYQVSDEDYTLVKTTCTPEGENLNDRISFLLDLLHHSFVEKTSPALSEEISVNQFMLEDENLSIYFSIEYARMDETREALSRSAIVCTLLQLEGVNGIMFYINDQALTSNSGRMIGLMTADSFETSINQSLREETLELYFTDESGTLLVPEVRRIVYRSGESREKTIIDELLAGPEIESHRATLDSKMILKQVTLKDGVCYLYWDPSFLENSLEVADYIPIYSIVNTLTETGAISRVQFVIDGVPDAKFRDNISLSTPFSRKLDYNVTNASRISE